MKSNRDIISVLNVLNEFDSSEFRSNPSIVERLTSVVGSNTAEQKLKVLTQRLREYAEMLIDYRSDSCDYERAELEENIRYNIGSDIHNLIEEFTK